MTSKQLRAAFRSSERTYGTLVVSDPPRWTAQVVQIGLNFVIIDTDERKAHGGYPGAEDGAR